MAPDGRPPQEAGLEETQPSGVGGLSVPDLSLTPPGPFAYSNSIMVLLCTDIVDSLKLKSRVGEQTAASVVRKHDRLFKKVISTKEGAEILSDRGDGFIAAFQSASDAVAVALLFQYALAKYDLRGERLHVRVGIHLGEVVGRNVDVERSMKVIGSAVDVTARICDLARADQILMSEAVFEYARRYVKRHPRIKGAGEFPELRWEAHGEFRFKGFDHPLPLYEVGHPEIAPFDRPEEGPKAQRTEETPAPTLTGWRPGAHLPIPGRKNWILRDKLGEGGFGESWLAQHRSNDEARAFKFCFDARSLEVLEREQEFVHRTHALLRECRHICRIHDSQLEKYPFFIEAEYCNRGNIATWSEFFGGLEVINTEFLIELVAQTAEALADAHSAGILHRDLKPSNILLHENAGGQIEVRVADFGMGGAAPPLSGARKDSTASGLLPVQPHFVAGERSGGGNPMYTPPEVLTGAEWTNKGDIYALGILLYQLMIGDLRRPIAPGWEREISDPALVEEISKMADVLPEQRPEAHQIASQLRNLDKIRVKPKPKVTHDGHSPPPAVGGRPPTINPATGEPSSGVLCRCGHLSDMGARYCAKCGSPLVSRCMYCGHEAEPHDRFCGKCGHKI